MLDFLSQAEKTFNAASRVLGTTGTATDAIMANVFSTYLGLFALAFNNRRHEVVINQLYPLMENYCESTGSPDSKQDLANMRTVLDRFIQEIKEENSKPILTLIDGGSTNN
jgi:hypothetical protein